MKGGRKHGEGQRIRATARGRHTRRLERDKQSGDPSGPAADAAASGGKGTASPTGSAPNQTGSTAAAYTEGGEFGSIASVRSRTNSALADIADGVTALDAGRSTVDRRMNHFQAELGSSRHELTTRASATLRRALDHLEQAADLARRARENAREWMGQL